MQDGYAGNAKKSTITELPNSKVITFKKGKWTVVDCYFVTLLSNSSFGTTIIYYDDVPVWMMQYHGEYPKEAIPFLKRALRSCYDHGKFVGGRGPTTYEERDGQGYTYHNSLPMSDFHSNEPHNFAGREDIVKYYRYRYGVRSRVVGWHEYSGQLLIPVKKREAKLLVLSPKAKERIRLMSLRTRKSKDRFVG